MKNHLTCLSLLFTASILSFLSSLRNSAASIATSTDAPSVGATASNLMLSTLFALFKLSLRGSFQIYLFLSQIEVALTSGREFLKAEDCRGLFAPFLGKLRKNFAQVLF